jgi:hypothetical protein
VKALPLSVVRVPPRYFFLHCGPATGSVIE